MMVHYLVNGDRQIEINNSYSSIKALKEYFPERDYRLLSKLAGSDWQRSNATESSIALGCVEICQSELDIRAAYTRIAGISRKQAFRALAIFPYHIPIGGAKKKERDLGQAMGLYLGTSFFLLNREYDLGLAKELRSSPWREAEPYADLSELRYRLIMDLCDELRDSEHQIFKAKTAAIWLLCEGALCLRAAQAAETSKNKDFSTQKNYIDALDEVLREGIALPAGSFSSSQDLFRNADLYIDRLAADLAVKNRDFENLRFKPYLAALRRWNRESKKLELLNQVRPGPRLGGARKEDY